MKYRKINENGFTLLELLITVSMLALITGIMAGALNMTHRAVEKGEKRIHYLEQIRTSITAVEEQMQSIFPFFYNDEGGQKKIIFSGQKDKMIFPSYYSLWLGAKGYSIITYEVAANDKGKNFLKVSEKILGKEKNNETRLFDAFDEIGFEYFLKNSFENGKWVEEWPADEKGLPEKIRINFRDGTKETAIVTGIYVKTNMTAPTGVPAVSK